HEVPVRVQRPARTDLVGPPAGGGVPRPGLADDVAVPGERVQHQDRVVARRAELPPRLVGERDLRELSTGLQRQRAEVDELPVAPRLILAPRTAGGHRSGGDITPAGRSDRPDDASGRSDLAACHGVHGSSSSAQAPTGVSAVPWVVTAAAAANPISRTARMASMCSRPTESRTSPGLTLLADCSSGVSWEGIVAAGGINRE